MQRDFDDLMFSLPSVGAEDAKWYDRKVVTTGHLLRRSCILDLFKSWPHKDSSRKNSQTLLVMLADVPKRYCNLYLSRKNNRQEELNNVTSHGSLFEIHSGIASVVDIDWLHLLALLLEPRDLWERSDATFDFEVLKLKSLRSETCHLFPPYYDSHDVHSGRGEDTISWRLLENLRSRNERPVMFDVSTSFRGKLTCNFSLKATRTAFGYPILAASQVKDVIASNDSGIPKKQSDFFGHQQLFWTSKTLGQMGGQLQHKIGDVDDL